MILKTLMFDLWIFFHKSKRCFWWKIAKTSKTVTKKLWKNFSFASFNRSRIPFDRSNVLFDWSKRNLELIDLGRNSMMKFFIVSIDREFLSIDRMLFSIDWTGIKNWSNEVVALWWISSFFRSIKKKVQPIKGTKFWIFTCFLIKC